MRKFFATGIQLSSRFTVYLQLVLILCSNRCIAQLSAKTYERKAIYPVNGASIYTKAIGEGEPIIIVHGGPGLDHSYLLPQFEVLAKRYQVIFYDQRGTGSSTGIIDSASITPKQFVEDLEKLRVALRLEKMNLLGHSWGGLLAMEYAIRFPDRIKSLILVSSAGASSDYTIPFLINREKRRTSADSAMIVQSLNSPAIAKGDTAAMQFLVRVFFRSYFHNQSLCDQLTISFVPTTAQHFFPILTLIMSHYTQYDLRSKLISIHSPALVLHGDDDPIPYVYAKQISELIPGAQFVLLKGCGHFPFIEANKELFESVETFLDHNK